MGAAALLGGLTILSWWTLPLVATGLALTVPALRHMVTGDSPESRRKLSWALAAGFLLGFSFFATDGFVPLMLTKIRGLSIAEASLVITLSTVSWSTGSWWQSRAVSSVRASRLVMGGAAAVALGTLGVATGLTGVSLVVTYAAWGLAGLGIGVAYPTIYLVTMERAGAGAEASTVALLLLIDSLGTATGTGLGGSAVALANTTGATLKAGLMGTFALALAAAIALMAISPRLSRPDE